METKRFTKNDSGFVCAHCGRQVLPLKKTSRNHCPFCLWSLHLDVNPGDRASDCGGELEPVSALPDPKRGYIIIHKCRKCGELRRNKAAYDVDVQPDDLRKIIALTARQI
ncbi:MAG: RNHCP domain-containing protein [Clostridia bacterium]|nr:RNHCP domain-containing protein [Clostridia bacterium]